MQEHVKSLQTSEGEVTFYEIKRAEVVIQNVIDSGSWGTVNKGKFCMSAVAIKQPHQWIMHATTVERMKREASNMARVHHPNLVTFFGANFDDGKLPMIVLELMEGNLRKTYENKALDKWQIISIFTDVAHALHYLHSLRAPLIHRDLSSPNVLLKFLPRSNTYTAKVSDLGSTNFEKNARTAGEGAIIYSAPEAFPSLHSSSIKQTVKMDNYSYGILFCEVINRRLPTRQYWNEMTQYLAKNWSSMHDIILSCTKYDPEERPTMERILNFLKYEVL